MQAALIAIPLIGSAVSAIGAIRQGQAASNEANYRAQLAEQQAAVTRQQAEITRQQAEREKVVGRQSEEDFRREQSRLMAARRARFGAAGVEQGSGSPLLVSEDFASEVELQALRIRSGADTAVTRLEQQAQQQEYQAGFQAAEAPLYRASGKNAKTGGFLRAGSLLLSGAGRAYGAYGG